MTIHYLVMDMAFASNGPGDSDDAFDEFTDRVTDALYDLEGTDVGILDPDITASLTNRTMSVLMGIEADSLRDALRLFSANVRSALHAARCVTEGWPTFQPEELPTAREVDLAET